jgi:hypothetical protein
MTRWCRRRAAACRTSRKAARPAARKKMELKLTNVAKASFEELLLDYQDFLRHRGLPPWERQDPRRQELVDRRLKTADEVAAWVHEVLRRESVEGGGPGDPATVLFRPSRPPGPPHRATRSSPPMRCSRCSRWPSHCSGGRSRRRRARSSVRAVSRSGCTASAQGSVRGRGLSRRLGAAFRLSFRVSAAGPASRSRVAGARLGFLLAETSV